MTGIYDYNMRSRATFFLLEIKEYSRELLGKKLEMY